jgi:hypothetical protein
MLAGSAAPALAQRDDDRHDGRHDNYRGPDRHDQDRHDHDRGPPPRDVHGAWRPEVRPRPGVVVVPGRRFEVPPARRRVYRDVVVVRPYGGWYGGYGHYHRDVDAWRWLGLTALTLVILDDLSERQQRALEDAQIRATTARVGEAIHWSDEGASGTVVTTREGTSTSGRYCREFQQTVTIGGRQEQAYGTACQQPDGAWEVVD